jgi:predicted PP-loop superfamily ATPase
MINILKYFLSQVRKFLSHFKLTFACPLLRQVAKVADFCRVLEKE